MNIATTHVTIHGQVQGVGYRAYVMEGARRLDLTGWVRNRLDGTVEAVFIGKPAAVQAMIVACKRGPRLAQVTHVKATDWIGIAPSSFTQKPTV